MEAANGGWTVIDAFHVFIPNFFKGKNKKKQPARPTSKVSRELHQVKQDLLNVVYIYQKGKKKKKQISFIS